MKDRHHSEEEEAMGEERFKLVVLGSCKVGKTSIIRRYLKREFIEKYKETCEDLHSRNFHIKGVTLPLDILDTNILFSDMRKLAIDSASAFLLVFAVDDVQSFKEMSEIFDEIKSRRADIDALPLIIVGNKGDIATKKIYEATATAWVSRLKPPVRYLEVSAKDDFNITSIFRNLLQLSGFPKCKAGGGSLESDHEEEKVEAAAEGVDRVNSIRFRPLNRAVFASERTAMPETPSLGVPVGDLRRNRSLRMKSPRREKEELERRPSDESKLSRSRSLIKRTKHLSLKIRGVREKPHEEIPDESDCIIS